MRSIQTAPNAARGPIRPAPDAVKRLDERAARLFERMDKEIDTRRSAGRAAALRGVAVPPDAGGGHVPASPSGPSTAPAPPFETSNASGDSGPPARDREWPRTSTGSGMGVFLGTAAAAVAAGLAAFALLRRRRGAA